MQKGFLPKLSGTFEHNVWISGIVPTEWDKTATILIHKKGDSNDPSKFRPITLESVPLKALPLAFEILSMHFSVEQRFQKVLPLKFLAL